jgi:long-chain acyl-CoA synthetase
VTHHLETLLRRAADQWPDSPALLDVDRRVTYGELLARASRIASGLAERGIGEGTRVGYLGRNAIEFYEVMYGVALVGGVTVPINWRLAPDEIAFLVDDSTAQLVVVDAEFAADLPPTTPRIVVGADVEEWIEASSGAVDPVTMDEDAHVLQSYTSGTTSMPKGVLFTNRSIAAVLEVGVRGLGIDHTSVLLAVMPNFHVGGSIFGLYALAVGCPLVVVRSFDPVDLPRQLERFEVTHFNIAPTMGSMLADAMGGTPVALPHLQVVNYGGAPITIKEYDRISTMLGAPLVQGYGMTENPTITRLLPHEHRGDLIRSVGRPYDGVEVTIRHPSGDRPAETGEAGEVWVRSATNTPGYWQRESDTRALFDDEGWMRTGDVGSLDDQGFLFLVDRVSDLIITGGENVYPAEVERVLITHPDVREVAVVGLPDALWGESVTAFVVLEDGRRLTGHEIIDWSRGRVAGFRRPRAVHVVPDLPRNANGKILRRSLRPPPGDTTA